MGDVVSIEVAASDGVKTVMRAQGPEDGPGIILVHGILHSSLVWKYQYADPLLAGLRMISYDVRGHGVADKPAEARYYEPDCFADELAAVIEASGIERPVLLGWSLGSRLIFNYFAKYGWDRIAGYFITGARTKYDPQAATSSGHNALLLGCTHDLEARITARREFVRACHELAPSPQDMVELTACAMMVPPDVLRHFIGRPLDEDGRLARLTMPIRVIHGARDAVCPLTAVARIPQVNPRAEMTIYEGVGHSPFFEAPARFNVDLADFVHACTREPVAKARTGT